MGGRAVKEMTEDKKWHTSMSVHKCSWQKSHRKDATDEQLNF